MKQEEYDENTQYLKFCSFYLVICSSKRESVTGLMFCNWW